MSIPTDIHLDMLSKNKRFLNPNFLIKAHHLISPLLKVGKKGIFSIQQVTEILG